MRHLLMILFFGCPILFLGAQPKMGKIMVGTTTNLAGTSISLLSSDANAAGVAFASYKSKYDGEESDATKTTILNLSPNVGYFVDDHILVGAKVTFQLYDDEEFEDVITSIGAGPLVRYYFSSQGNFYPFAQGAINFGQMSFGPEDDEKTNMLEFGGGVGGAFFLGECVSLDIFAGYNHVEAKGKTDDSGDKDIVNAFGFGFGLSIFL